MLRRTATVLACSTALLTGLGAQPARAEQTSAVPDLPPAGTPALGWTAGLSQDRSGPVLSLLDPQGRTRRTHRLPSDFDGELVGISYDAHHVVTSHITDVFDAKVVTIWDTHADTEAIIYLDLMSSPWVADVTARGVFTGGYEGYRLYDFAGAVQHVYPNRWEDYDSTPVAKPSGDRFLQSRYDGAVVVRSTSTGEVLAVTSPPPGTRCRPTGGWDGQRFRMTCSTEEERAAGGGTAYAGSYQRSGPVTQLAPKGWPMAWPTSPRLVARSTTQVARWEGGRLTPLDLAPAGTPGSPSKPYLAGVGTSWVIVADAAPTPSGTRRATWLRIGDNRVLRSNPWPFGTPQTTPYTSSVTINPARTTLEDLPVETAGPRTRSTTPAR